MADRETVKAALELLDHGSVNQWNADGTPSEKAVQALAGDEGITAADIAAEFPDYRRDLSLVSPEVSEAAKPGLPSETEDMPGVQPIVGEEAPDPTQQKEFLSADQVTEARQAVAHFDAQLVVLDREINERSNARDILIAERDKFVVVLDAVANNNQSEIIQHYQKVQLAERHRQAGVMLDVRKVLGKMAPAYAPSTLDGALRGRAKGPSRTIAPTFPVPPVAGTSGPIA